ncbi:Lrp/AsnC ligand binding domain-containing protein [Sneathiella chinensis]|uniref:AsnC family transcriptional regulator n=1 Tax=Sneathiella chinensis TaxID=349750 RepID=A0ABQ5U6W1_9PROT|nr:Lrp/AsnC ligand binding domain-containing protein [Sneathiella chinensis]GLQ07890.1 AsnC family transcriptional regulator [Sneathiella chinensis]
MDKIDKKILKELQTDGRITMTELSNRVGLSKTPCIERVRRLEASGVIQGYGAYLDPTRLEAGHIAFVQVTLKDTTTSALQEFNQAVKRVPQIQACHMIAGNFDYLLKVRTRDVAEYRQFLGTTIAQLPQVQHTSTFIVMEAVSDRLTFSIPD